jgi:hypothetical protein
VTLPKLMEEEAEFSRGGVGKAVLPESRSSLGERDGSGKARHLRRFHLTGGGGDNLFRR